MLEIPLRKKEKKNQSRVTPCSLKKKRKKKYVKKSYPFICGDIYILQNTNPIPKGYEAVPKANKIKFNNLLTG